MDIGESSTRRRCRRGRHGIRFGLFGALVSCLALIGCTAPGPSIPPGGSQTAGVSGTASTPLPSATLPIASPSASPSATFTAAHGRFRLTGSMAVARSDPSATLLADGRVLIVGGCGCVTAELYEPATDTFTRTGPMLVARTDGLTATLLLDGRVLIAGGADVSQTALASAELYDPRTGTFSLTGTMTTARSFHSATLLPGGKVLVAGGVNGAGAVLSSAEVYDPQTGSFSRTGSLRTARATHTSTPLPNGRVLVVGGAGSCAQGRPIASAELFDPASGAFSPSGSLTVGREGQSAVQLIDGRILVLGGSASCVQEEPLASAELYDPGAGTFASTGPMALARDGQSAVLLSDGRVLVVGGANSTAELYDPTTMSFLSTSSMSAPRDSQSATRLLNGVVLVSGGAADGSSAELYQP